MENDQCYIFPEISRFEEASPCPYLMMVPNFILPDEVFHDDGSKGSCYVNSRLMLLCSYIIENKSSVLFRYSQAYKDPLNKFFEETFDADSDLIRVANEYIAECKKTNTNIENLRRLYNDFAKILFSYKASIVPESGDTFFNVLEVDTSQKIFDYGELVKDIEDGKYPRKAFYIVITGHYCGEIFNGAHETLLHKTQYGWVYFDDLSSYITGNWVKKH